MIKRAFSILTNKRGEWLVKTLRKYPFSMLKNYALSGIKADFELSLEDFELFWYLKAYYNIKDILLITLSFSINYI
jgi:hypothetical protein